MKKVLIFSALFLLASVSLSAQVVKGAGLWYFNGLPNVTPSVATGTEVAYSINNKSLFKWNRTTSAWVAVVQDSSITNELQDLILSNDTLSLTLSDSIVLMAQYRNHVWEIANLSDTTSITGDIEGDIAYTSTGDTIAFRGASAWLPFTGGGGGGTFNSFNIAGDTGSDIVTDGQTVTIAGGYGINTAETGGTVTVTADTSQLATQSDISGFGTMSSFTVAGGSGTPQTITNGNTLIMSEGYGINTLAAATDNVRTEVDTTQIATQNDISGLPSGTGTNQRIVVWTGTNSQGNSTQLQSAAGVTLDANLAYRITGGTTASRPTGAAGMWYWNTSNSWWDTHNGTSWFNPARSATTDGLFTAGSVLFGGSAGTIQQDNAALFWDNTNKRLGINVAAPTYQLHVKSVTGAAFAFIQPGSGANSYLFFTNANNYIGSEAGGFLQQGVSYFSFRTKSGMSISPGLYINGSNFVGSGTTSPDRALHSEVSDAVTNTMVFPLRLTHVTSGTAAAGSGAGLEFEAESAGGTNRVAGTIENPYTTATNAAEVSDLVFRAMNAGVLGEKLRVLGNGTLQISTLSGTATQMVGATSGNILTTFSAGYGLTFASGALRADTTALKAQFLPLTLSGTTTFNTSGNLFNVQGRMSFVSSTAETWPITFLSQEWDGIDFQQNRGSNSVYGDLVGGFQCRPRYNGAINAEVASITGRYTGDGTTRRGEMVIKAHNGSGLYQSGIFGGDTTIMKPAQLFIAAPNLQNGLEVNNQKTVRLPGYGVGGKEAADLSKTNSAYIQSFATDGTEIEATAGAGLVFSSGVLSTSQSFLNDYDASILLTAITGTPDTLDANSSVKSADWSFNAGTNTYTYNGTTGRYYSVSISAQGKDGTGNAETLIIAVYRNNTLTSAVAQGANPSGTAQPFALHGQAILQLTNGDTINAKVSTSGVSEDFVLENYSLIVKEI